MIGKIEVLLERCILVKINNHFIYMKTKLFLLMVLSIVTTAANAQTYKIKTVNFFGDRVTTYQDKNRNNVAAVTTSKDNFRNVITDIKSNENEEVVNLWMKLLWKSESKPE